MTARAWQMIEAAMIGRKTMVRDVFA